MICAWFENWRQLKHPAQAAQALTWLRYCRVPKKCGCGCECVCVCVSCLLLFLFFLMNVSQLFDCSCYSPMSKMLQELYVQDIAEIVFLEVQFWPRNCPGGSEVVRLGWKADPEVLLDRDRQRKGKRASTLTPRKRSSCKTVKECKEMKGLRGYESKSSTELAAKCYFSPAEVLACFCSQCEDAICRLRPFSLQRSFWMFYVITV